MPTDPPRDTTAVWNRDSILELLTRELARSDSSGVNLTVFMARVGLPKRNPELVESQSGNLMAEVAKRFALALRPYDHIGRYSGRQFLILVWGWDATQAPPLAEKLRKAIAQAPFELAECPRIQAAVSIVPAATADFRSQDIQAVLAKLENALNSAEATGGNQVVLLNTNSPPSRRLLARRRLRISSLIIFILVLVAAGLLFLIPSWTCAPNLIGDLLDTSELPPPLPENCILTQERPSDAVMEAIEKRRDAGRLELQGTVTCKIATSRKRTYHSGEPWPGNLYADGSLQYRRHVLLAATEDVPGGTLFTVEQCVTPWWRYLTQSQQYCRVQDPPWK